MQSTALGWAASPQDHCHACPTFFTEDGEPQVQRPVAGFEEWSFCVAGLVCLGKTGPIL